ncbi:MAG: hypothetical protein NWR72_14615 [Bacteroidia bacterium]|nr:hypothetical protein [Bacteroidia bacterium]
MADNNHVLRNIPIIWEGEAPPEVPDFPPALEIGAQAVSSAILGGINGMVREGMDQFEAYQTGKLDHKQYTYRIVRKGSEAAMKQGSKAVAALTMRQGLIFAAKKMGAKRLLVFAKGSAMISVAYGVVDQGVDTYKYFQGELKEVEFKVQTSQNVGSTGGAIGGAAMGALLGSAVPGLGTVMGAFLGMLGSASGASLGKAIGEKWFIEEENTSSSDHSAKE